MSESLAYSEARSASDDTHTLFGQTMGYVAATAAFFTLGVPSSTSVTPGAAQAAAMAVSCSARERTTPDTVTIPKQVVVPYPPGIPLLMPGERAGAGDGPILGYLKALQDFDRKFPGFGYDIHGVRRGTGGGYEVMCVQRHAAGQDGAPPPA